MKFMNSGSMIVSSAGQIDAWVGWLRLDRKTSLTNGLPSRCTWSYARVVLGPVAVLLLVLQAAVASTQAMTPTRRAAWENERIAMIDVLC
jgi:hypothetical protein